MSVDREEPTKWQVALKVIVFLIMIIQFGFAYWAKWITTEVLDSKPERSAILSDISHIKEDVGYLRDQFDNQRHRNER